jgi:predicted membrane metal-binding protein
MKLSAPKQVTWIIALVLGVLGIVANLTAIPVVTATIGFWLLAVAWVLLLIAAITRGL